MSARNPRGVAAARSSRAVRASGFGRLAVAGLLMGADTEAKWLVFLLLTVGAVAVVATHGHRNEPS